MIALEIRDNDNNIEEKLEIFPDDKFPIAITYSISSVRDISKRSGDWTKTFSIPLTAKNNTALNYLFNLNQADITDIKSRKSATLKVRGVPQISGTIRFTGFNNKSYKADMQGSNSEWLDLIDGKSIRDISAFDVSHSFTTSNIVQGWQDYEDGTKDYVYAPVKYGLWSGYYNGKRFVTLEDLRPAIRMAAIVKGAFNDIGYTVVSDFFDGNNSKLDGSRLTLPYVGDGFALSIVDLEEASFLAASTQAGTVNGISFTQSIFNVKTFLEGNTGTWTVGKFNDASADTSPYYNTSTGIFTGFTGRTRFELGTNLCYKATTANQPDWLYMDVVKKSGSTYTILSSAGFYMKNVVSSYKTQNILAYSLTTPFINMISTDQVFVRIYVKRQNSTFPDPGNTSTNIDVIQITGGLFASDISSVVNRGQSINIAEVIPDFKQIDVIIGLKEMFNLYFKPDIKNKIIYIEPRDSAYLPLSDAIDITNKVYADEAEISILSDNARELEFSPGEDSNDEYLKHRNEWAKTFYDNEVTDLGAALLTLSNRFKKGREQYGSRFFSSTMRSYTAFDDGFVNNLINGGDEHISAMLKTSNVNNAPLPSYDFWARILYYTYKNRDNAMRWDDGTGAAFINIGKYPLLTYEGDVANAVPSLTYGGVDGIVSKFFNGSIRTLEKGIMMDVPVVLNSVDISNLNLLRPVYIDRPAKIKGYYLIEELSDFDPVNFGKSTLSLVKVDNYTPLASDEIIDPPDNDGNIFDQFGPPDNFDGFVNGNNGFVGGGSPNLASPPTVGLGWNNQFFAGSGVIPIGNNLSSPYSNQVILGQFNAPQEDAILMIGVGSDEDSRINAFSVKTDGEIRNYGGNVYIRDGNSNLVKVLQRTEDSRFKETYIRD